MTIDTKTIPTGRTQHCSPQGVHFTEFILYNPSTKMYCDMVDDILYEPMREVVQATD